MNTESINIKSRVVSVVSKCTGVPSDVIEPEHWQEPLTGHTFNLSTVDLLYILFEIEEEFHILISPNFLEQYGFNSLNSICSIVQGILEHI